MAATRERVVLIGADERALAEQRERHTEVVVDVDARRGDGGLRQHPARAVTRIKVYEPGALVRDWCRHDGALSGQRDRLSEGVAGHRRAQRRAMNPVVDGWVG